MSPTRRPARFLAESLVAPKPGLLGVVTTLTDFAIITFAVEPAALAKHLPEGFEPEIFTLADGTGRALISAVTFQDLDFRLCACPWPKSSFGQTNYRAYVIYKGARIAWFFGTSLATPFVLIPRHLWLLPWHHATMQFRTAWDGERCTHYELATTANWGRAQVELLGTDKPIGCLDGFTDQEDAAVILTHALSGYYRCRDRKVGTYNIWHDKLEMRRATAKEANFQVFHDLDLTTTNSRPHSVLLQRRTEFTIFLPPHLVP